jgi:gluconolactonase
MLGMQGELSFMSARKRGDRFRHSGRRLTAALIISPFALLYACGGEKGGANTTSSGGSSGMIAAQPTGGATSAAGGNSGAPPQSGAGAGGVAVTNGTGGGAPKGGSAGMLPGGAGGITQGAGGTAGGGGGGTAGGGGSAGAAQAGAAGQGGAVSYPMLDASKIGNPVMVAGGFGLAESPLWDPCGHQLLFSDVQGGGGSGVINAIGANGQVSVFMSNTGNTNGIAFDIDGSLILTQMGGKPGHIARRDKTGNVQRIDPAGSMLHTPDDVVVRSDGTIYFTDGDFCPIGNLLGYNSRLPVYMIKPGTTALINSGTVSGPNGIELSPDEQSLYVNGFGEGSVWKFSVAADGSLTKGATPFVSGLTNPDSLCLDAAGNLYVAVSTGLQVLRPDGSKVKLIPITSGAGSCASAGVTNCTFGGDDGKTLYITSWTTLFKVEGMPIPGLDWVVSAKRAKCM